MSKDIIKCIRRYIEDRYQGGLIGISDLADYCTESEGNILIGLIELEKRMELKIITRYFCPETHRMQNETIPYCLSCNLKYPGELIYALTYCEPTPVVSLSDKMNN
jgi:hypothetical protein